MKRLLQNVRILWRAESMLNNVRLHSLAKKSSVLAFASLVGVIGVVMLNVAGFFALRPVWEATGAALIVAVVDLVLAIALAAYGRTIAPGPEVDMLTEVRDMALVELESGAAEFEQAFSRGRKELQQIVQHPLAALAPGVLVPLFKSILSSLRSESKSD
jgi:hypothetical protein